MSKRYAVFRYWYNEGQLDPNSRQQFGEICEDKTHVEWAASYHTRVAGVVDTPYVFFCEPVNDETERWEEREQQWTAIIAQEKTAQRKKWEDQEQCFEQIRQKPAHRPADVCLITGQPLFCPECHRPLGERGTCTDPMERCSLYWEAEQTGIGPYLDYNERHQAARAAERSDRFLCCGPMLRHLIR